ncbi:hypothetical protein ACFL59_15390 [Planctomycetota bacterium]
MRDMVKLKEGDLLDPNDPEDMDLLDDEDSEPEVDHYPLPPELEAVWEEKKEEKEEEERSPETAPADRKEPE